MKQKTLLNLKHHIFPDYIRNKVKKGKMFGLKFETGICKKSENTNWYV